VIILGVKNDILAIVLAAVILVSTLFASLPLVRADYTVDHASFPPDLPGDVNYDGKVDGIDIVIVSRAFGSTFGGVGWNPRADLNDDGKVDGIDLVIVARLFVTYYDTSATPVAYSTSFEFTVPDDGGLPVWYYILVRFYVSTIGPYYLVAGKSVDDAIRNVKINNTMVSASQQGGLFNVSLGQQSGDYHLLELEYLESTGAGLINFTVKTPAGGAAWLDRFRICVPNYSGIEYTYRVATSATFSNEDDYFLSGYADDYINSVHVDGLAWSDWMWNLSSTETINAWRDGFLYPLGHRTPPYSPDVSFTFGNNGSGLLDFQMISWTFQQEKIGAPKFYTSTTLNPYNRFTGGRFLNTTTSVYDGAFYAGSQWMDPVYAGESERDFETRTRINAKWVSTDGFLSLYFNTSLEVGLGVTSAQCALTNGATNDVGITMNLTCLYFNTNWTSQNPPDPKYNEYWDQWCLTLKNVTLDAFSCDLVEIPALEYYPNGQSIVKPDWTVGVDYVGTVVMFVFSALAPAIGITSAILGSLFGLGIQGVDAAAGYNSGQQLNKFNETVNELHHRQELYNDHFDSYGTDSYGPLAIFSPDKKPGNSTNDIVFFQLNPIAEKRCGLTKFVLKGQIGALRYRMYMPYKTPEELGLYIPLGELEMDIYIPWFT
jgi:hypothetical protein